MDGSRDGDMMGGAGPASAARSWGDQHELKLLRSVVQTIGEAIIVTSPELDPPGPLIEYVNPGFERMTGYAADEVLGRSPRFLQGDGTDRTALDELRTALRAGRAFSGEAVNYRKDGTPYVVEWLISPVLEAGRIVRWVAAQRDVTERRQGEERQKRMADELNHRVNNSLAAVQSVAAQTFRDEWRSVGEVRNAFRDRLLALARVHTLLARGFWEGVPLQILAERQLTSCNGKAGGAEIEGPEMRLRPGAAIALGMALHELATNALRHGALSAPTGHVRLVWSVEPGEDGELLRLHWVEEGGPPVAAPPRRGFGTRVIERGLAHGMRARVSLRFAAAGLDLEVDAPLGAVAAAPCRS
ncbi:HWE histidine kinase domain-containing protein [Belnapia rosea]|uniref:histidine kinase n=1 Tax=Belnapia rosea TaxID=938405 RepID=A0A1G6S4A2_9PROT|nr:HWE histidine kinase domain-containing protein [Belnapia rosea]SDB72114.1 PAS domain S-box-containing protein [Belnapia rosea]SDD10967.1 PAS domain S-box-containing protein [Belnapia rosea]